MRPSYAKALLGRTGSSVLTGPLISEDPFLVLPDFAPILLM